MKLIRLAIIVLLLGVCTNGLAYGQSSGYGPPQGYDYTQDHDHDQDRGYDDRGYDDRGYYDDRSRPGGEVGFFYNELSPYGDWVLTRDFGWAWFPRDVHPYWSPYTEGRWVVTEYGWTWVSYEPFGWATYHYGRWVRDVRFGWLWVPGTTWGPAWVSWQHGGGYVGWAPLPPAVEFEIGFGIRLGRFDLNVGIRSDAYTFVSERSFLESRLSGHLIPRARNVTIFHHTSNVTNYTYVDQRVMNRGVDVRQIERATGRHVHPLRVARGRERARSEVAASEVRIYRPEQQLLESVRAVRRMNTDQRATPPAGRDQDRPVMERRDPHEVRVAPRTDRTPPIDRRQLELQERREKKELAQHQAEEKQLIDKLYQQDLARAQAKADRDKVEKRHQVEREALQQDQRNAEQQLVARQEIKRQAALLAKAQRDEKPQDKVKAADPKDDKRTEKAKKEKAEREKAKKEKAKREKRRGHGGGFDGGFDDEN